MNEILAEQTQRDQYRSQTVAQDGSELLAGLGGLYNGQTRADGSQLASNGEVDVKDPRYSDYERKVIQLGQLQHKSVELKVKMAELNKHLQPIVSFVEMKEVEYQSALADLEKAQMLDTFKGLPLSFYERKVREAESELHQWKQEQLQLEDIIGGYQKSAENYARSAEGLSAEIQGFWDLEKVDTGSNSSRNESSIGGGSSNTQTEEGTLTAGNGVFVGPQYQPDGGLVFGKDLNKIASQLQFPNDIAQQTVSDIIAQMHMSPLHSFFESYKSLDLGNTLGDAFDYVGGLGTSIESYAQSSIEQLPTILQNKIGFQFGTIKKTHQILDDLVEGVDSTILFLDKAIHNPLETFDDIKTTLTYIGNQIQAVWDDPEFYSNLFEGFSEKVSTAYNQYQNGTAYEQGKIEGAVATEIATIVIGGAVANRISQKLRGKLIPGRVAEQVAEEAKAAGVATNAALIESTTIQSVMTAIRDAGGIANKYRILMELSEGLHGATKGSIFEQFMRENYAKFKDAVRYTYDGVSGKLRSSDAHVSRFIIKDEIWDFKHFQSSTTVIDTDQLRDYLLEGAKNNKSINYLFSSTPNEKNIKAFLKGIEKAKDKLNELEQGNLIKNIKYNIKYLDENGIIGSFSI